ncbi:sugar phosphate isomerase/epimerase family protein [Sporanaerobacter acetigenes]|uniref:Sugar phosphate isomerase/epimerase n=1 Tax=Sporanaerobacter acetigenes DSM 13106 TaxID=1123281 RepID=A0A1M5WB88_9FIRM|nr:TIM barrel protein [Sporanaerobacter acetigenes]SHH84762.1 Sugar phosphate isomerase/epimerase [Sporanaerobacter acetigenes DSM 13106]
MKNKILKCISTIDYFDKDFYNAIDIGVEIQDFTEPSLLDSGWKETVEKYKESLQDFSNTLSIHGPFLDLKPISPDRTIKEASINRYITTLNIGEKLNADYIVFHSQINPWINDPILKSLNNNLNRKFWVEILEKVEDFKGTILIENVFEDDPVLLKELIDTIDLPNIKVCLDIGHAKLRDDIEYWINVLKENIEYIHLHWNRGVYDEHLKPSCANFLYVKELLKKYEISPYIALEYDLCNRCNGDGSFCIEEAIEIFNE